jgi:hypothetical protein
MRMEHWSYIDWPGTCTDRLSVSAGSIAFGQVYEFCCIQIAAESLYILTLKFLKCCQVINFMFCALLLVL